MCRSLKALLAVALCVGVASLASVANAGWLDLSTAPCASNSEYSPDYSAAKAFDQNTGTRWAANGGTSWVEVDLGGDYALDAVEIDWRNGGTSYYWVGVRTAAQGASLDPTTYTSVGRVDGRSPVIDDTATGWDSFDFQTGSVLLATGVTATSTTASTGAVGRYLMVYGVPDMTNITSNSIWEINVGGTAVPEPCMGVLVGVGVLGLLAYAWRKRK